MASGRCKVTNDVWFQTKVTSGACHSVHKISSSEADDVIVVSNLVTIIYLSLGGILWMTLGDNGRQACSSTLNMLEEKYFDNSTTEFLYFHTVCMLCWLVHCPEEAELCTEEGTRRIVSSCKTHVIPLSFEASLTRRGKLCQMLFRRIFLVTSKLLYECHTYKSFHFYTIFSMILLFIFLCWLG